MIAKLSRVSMTRTLLAFLTAGALGYASVPLLTFPTSLTSSVINAAATDAAGNVYVTGTTFYDYTPAKNSFPATPGTFQNLWGSRNCIIQPVSGYECQDAFVAKFDSAGQLIYASYLGGRGEDEGLAIAVDVAGNAWVTGYTSSPDFPVTANGLQKTYAGGTLITPLTMPPYQGDAFVAEVNPTGTALIYSSLLGGTGADVATAITLDPLGRVVISGATFSSDFPVTTAAPGPPPSQQIGFVYRLNPAPPSVIYSTYFEAPIAALAVDSAGSAYLAGASTSTQPVITTPGAYQTTGSGAYVVKLSPDGNSRLFATLLGGTGAAASMMVDAAGSVWIVGSGATPALPVTVPPAAHSGQAFVARFSADGSALLVAFAVSVQLSGPLIGYPRLLLPMSQPFLQDSSGNIFVIGLPNPSSPVPFTPDALEKSTCDASLVISKWSPQGSLLYYSYSREGPPLTIDAAGRMPISHAFNTIILYDPNADQRQSGLACVTNGASFFRDSVSPGELISLWGDRLGPDVPAHMQIDSAGKVATKIGNTRVLFNGIPGAMLYADANQINVTVPWSIAPLQNITVTVEYNGVDSVAIPVYDNTSTPGIFMVQPSYPASQGAILNENGTLNSGANPAAPGSIISIFCTGMGLLSPLPQDGEIIQDATHLLVTPVPVLFPGTNGPVEGQITYEGATPTLVAGVIQVNVRLPDSFPTSVTLPGPVPIYMHIPNGPITPMLATVAVQ